MHHEPIDPIRLTDLTAFPLAATVGETPQLSVATMTQRQGLVLRVASADGAFGWGEVWCNFPPRGMFHKRDLLEHVFAPAVLDRTFSSPSALFHHLERTFARYALHVGEPGPIAHCIAGIDLAVWDLCLRRAATSAAAFFGIQHQARPYASSINAVAVPRVIPAYAAAGYREFKVKVGFDPATDATTVAAARDILNRDCPDGRLLIDANQAWSLDDALRRIAALAPHDLTFVEEPIASNSPVADWQHLAAAVGTPLAGGENLYGAAAFTALMAPTALTYIQPDVAKWGGLTGGLALIEALGDNAHRLWPHCMGTGISQVASLVLAAHASPDSCAEMDVNPNPLRTDLLGIDLSLAAGAAIDLPAVPGLVPEPDPRRLHEFAAA